MQTQAELGQKRLLATKTKKELEDLISEHKEASQKAKAIERQFQVRFVHDSTMMMFSLVYLVICYTDSCCNNVFRSCSVSII